MADSGSTPPAESPGWILPAVLLAAVVLVFGFRELGGEALDFAVQDRFREGGEWLAPREHPVLHPLLYDGPKAALILLALGLIWSACLPRRAPAWLGRRRALYLLACLALIPVVATQLRAVSRMATPSAVAAYGGTWEHRVLFESRPDGYPSNAFPAGHASGGFALLGLAFAWRARRARALGAAAGVLAGGAMGLYQVARGEHFLSHTLATGLLAWMLAALLARWIGPAVSAPTSS